MRKTKKMIAIFVLCIYCILCCGAGMAKNDPKLDIGATPVYEIISIDTFINRALVNFSSVENDFDKHAVAFGGTSQNVNEKEKSFEVVSDTDKTKKICVKTKDSDSIKNVSDGQKIVVYGIADFNEKKKSITITADALNYNGELKEDSGYCFRNNPGKYVNPSDLVKRELADGIVNYLIPKAWTSCELFGEEKSAVLGVDAEHGEAYYLNSIKGKKEPEFFCIFYFDNDRYVAYDTDKKETLGIERSIITNICPDEISNLKWNSFSGKHYTYSLDSTRTPWGIDFNYYVANYGAHRVEFVFTQAKNGICVMMYAYNGDDSSLEDILTIMRTLKVK